MISYLTSLVQQIKRNENGTALATNVKISLFVSELDSINDKSLDYRADAYLQMHWVDHRLIHHHNHTLHLWPALIDKMWIPDLFFVNAKRADLHKIVNESKYHQSSNF